MGWEQRRQQDSQQRRSPAQRGLNKRQGGVSHATHDVRASSWMVASCRASSQGGEVLTNFICLGHIMFLSSIQHHKMAMTFSCHSRVVPIPLAGHVEVDPPSRSHRHSKMTHSLATSPFGRDPHQEPLTHKSHTKTRERAGGKGGGVPRRQHVHDSL